MLGGYPVGVLGPRPENGRYADLDHYLRLEYPGRMNVDAVLADLARASRMSRSGGRERIRKAIRGFTAALKSVAARNRRKVPTLEV